MKEIIIESLVLSQKTAVIKDGKLDELLIEENENEKVVSNIYRGIVKKVIPGISACFVDVGFEKLAYLQLEEGHSIKSGQEVIVQVNKEEIGTKGAKLNREISLSGRYLVYIPTNDRITISNKIAQEKERFRLKKIMKAITKGNLGWIIRTEANGCSDEELKEDVENLTKKYEEILKENKLGIGPKLLFKELDGATKYVRDNINESIDKIVVNNEAKYNEIRNIIKNINKDYLDKIILEENKDVFDLYRVDDKIEKCLNKKVWLKSGGYLIIDKTEALTVIDVNTGKFTGNVELEETVFKTNLEAAKEIARQLRLRDIGGIIIADFIDMHKKSHKNELLSELESELSKEKRKTEVLGMTRLGLVEIVRRRNKEPIDKYYLDGCNHCQEKYGISSINSILDNIEKEVMRIKEHTLYRDITIELNENVYRQISSKNKKVIDKISKIYGISMKLSIKGSIEYEKINIIYNS